MNPILRRYYLNTAYWLSVKVTTVLGGLGSSSRLIAAQFVGKHAGVLLLGPPGTGKSHIAISLAVAAIQAGYTVLYISAFDLAQEMAEAESTGTRKELVNKLMQNDLLVLEDLGQPLIQFWKRSGDFVKEFPRRHTS